MRRPAPRPLAEILGRLRSEAEPATVLARVQAAWPRVAGPAIAAEAEPVGEREGVLTVVCRSAVWAQELELLGRDLIGRLNEELGHAGSPILVELRARTGGAPERGRAGSSRRFP